MIPFRLRQAALTACLLISLGACGSSGDDEPDAVPAGAPLDISILHINDSHSRLDPETVALNLKTTAAARRAVNVDRGGFARVTALIGELAGARDNVLKLHAGDAVTGDLYFTLDSGKSDAAMMNTVCFDAFVLGNHEFDSGDAGLKTFLDFLRAGSCKTEVLSANVKPQVGVSPLAKTSATDYFKPSTVLVRRGQKIGLIGITIADKTKSSSRPDATTQFFDEAVSAQAEIDAVRAQGVDKIIVMSHHGYDADKALAGKLSGVDVIVGGDSHTLLGDAGLASYGITPGGAYPTLATDKDGKTVCIVQAWQYTHAVGSLDVSFDAKGEITKCAGTAYLPIGENFAAASGAALTADDIVAIHADIASQKSIRIVKPSASAEAVLKPFRDARSAFGSTLVGTATEELCLRRVPGTKLDPTRSTLGDVCNKSARVNQYGGDIQQLVAQAYLDQGKVFGQADLSIQNAGGVRIDFAAGDVTVAKVFGLLPFKNTLVRLRMTGQEIVAALEDATDNVVANKSTGAFPYSAGLRWTVDLSKPKGQRYSNLQVLQAGGGYAPLSMTASYYVIVNDFMADGGDRYDTLKTITGARRENTYLDYADSFLSYVKKHPALSRLPTSEYSTQGFTDIP